MFDKELNTLFVQWCSDETRVELYSLLYELYRISHRDLQIESIHCEKFYNRAYRYVMSHEKRFAYQSKLYQILKDFCHDIFNNSNVSNLDFGINMIDSILGLCIDLLPEQYAYIPFVSTQMS